MTLRCDPETPTLLTCAPVRFRGGVADLLQQCEHLAVVRHGELLGVVGLADLARAVLGQTPRPELFRRIGSTAHNSFAREVKMIAEGILPGALGNDLRDASELVSMLRIRDHAGAIAEVASRGHPPG